MSEARNACPIFLVIAATNSPKHGVTGAAIGTEIVIDMLSDRYCIEWVPLRTNGLGLLGARTTGGRLLSMLKAAGMSMEALARLAWRGLTGPKVEIVYLLPAASTMGILRNAGIVLVVQLFHRHSQLVFHIRNGNYFDRRSPWKEYLQRYVNSRAYRILVLSRLLLPDDLSHTGASEAQLCILPNCIDESVLPDVLPDNTSLPPLRVLYLSNFIAEKGYLALLSAAERLADRGLAERFAFTFHGKWLSNSDRQAAELRAGALQQRGMSVYVGGGLQDRRAVQTLYANHHVFCLPTLYAAEAQPRSILEAMANGCAVLATHYRSIPEQVIEGETGFLVPDQDPDRLADCLVDFVNGDPLAMGQAGQLLFDDRFSHASVRQILLDSLTKEVTL